MSYNICLRLPRTGVLATVPRQFEGGTIDIDGKEDADINITYNYSPFFKEHLDLEQGIRCLYNKWAGDVISKLESAIKQLGTSTDTDYWKATPGNAGHALNILLYWAKMHPDCVFDGD